MQGCIDRVAASKDRDELFANWKSLYSTIRTIYLFSLQRQRSIQLDASHWHDECLKSYEKSVQSTQQELVACSDQISNLIQKIGEQSQKSAFIRSMDTQPNLSILWGRGLQSVLVRPSFPILSGFVLALPIVLS